MNIIDTLIKLNMESLNLDEIRDKNDTNLESDNIQSFNLDILSDILLYLDPITLYQLDKTDKLFSDTINYLSKSGVLFSNYIIYEDIMERNKEDKYREGIHKRITSLDYGDTLRRILSLPDVYIAGGAAVYILNDFCDKDMVEDIDIFITRSNKKSYLKCIEILRGINSVILLEENPYFIHKIEKPKFFMNVESKPIQIIFVTDTIEEILNKFDFDYVQCAVNISTIIKTIFAKESHKYRMILRIHDVPYIIDRFIKRLKKAIYKGFYIPGLSNRLLSQCVSLQDLGLNLYVLPHSFYCIEYNKGFRENININSGYPISVSDIRANCSEKFWKEHEKLLAENYVPTNYQKEFEQMNVRFGGINPEKEYIILTKSEISVNSLTENGPDFFNEETREFDIKLYGDNRFSLIPEPKTFSREEYDDYTRDEYIRGFFNDQAIDKYIYLLPPEEYSDMDELIPDGIYLGHISYKLKVVKYITKNCPSGYILFCDSNRFKIRNENPGIRSSDLLVELGKQWGKLDNDKKQVYIDMAITINRVMNGGNGNRISP